MLRKFFGNRSGATAIEYGLMVAMAALAIIASVFLIGDEVVQMYDDTGDAFTQQ